jgi:putative acetyltransferase
MHRLREAVAKDYDQLAEVMFDAVHNGRSEYSRSQREAWVPQVRGGPEWQYRLAAQTVFVAENSDRIVGFMSLAEGGYIDFAYVRPSDQGSGVFRRLYQLVESHAAENRMSRLWVHASLMAEPAFSAVGFTVVKTESVEIGTELLDRFEMAKDLPA